MTKNLEKYEDVELQKTLLEVLLSSPETFSVCEPIIRSGYFDPKLRNGVEFVKNYYNEHSVLPDTFQIKAETKVDLESRPSSKDQDEWAKNSIEEFCRYYGMISAIDESINEIQSGHYGGIFERMQTATEISIEKDVGLNYFTQIDERIARMLENPPTLSTGWKSVDEVLYGGIGRQQLILFLGISGVGKSFTLANLGLNFVKKGLNVLFLSLELASDIVGQRFDQMITGINGAQWKYKTDEISHAVKAAAQKNWGDLFIDQMPSGTTPNQMRAHLKQFHLKTGYYPDLFIVDYLDEMLPNQKVSVDNIAERDKMSATQLRQIGVDFNMATATASQLNREAIEAPVLTQAHVAGGMGKIRISDAAIAIRMDQSQKHRGIMEFIFLKTRNSEGISSPLLMQWVNEFVTIKDGKNVEERDQPKPLNFKPRTKKDPEDLGKSHDQTTNDIFGDFDRRTLPNL